MTTPTDAELNELLGKHWPAFALQGALPLTWLRSAMREAIAKWGQPQAGASGEPVVHKQGCPALGGYGNGVEPCCCGAAPPQQAVREPQPMPDLTQLTERGAEAWAGVDAQALRDGVASAGSEPVAQAEGVFEFWWADHMPNATQEEAWREWCCLLRPGAVTITNPSPPEGMGGGWMPIETAPKYTEHGVSQHLLLGYAPDEIHEDGFVSQGYWMEAEEDAPDNMGHDGGWVDVHFDFFRCGRSFGAEAYRSAGTQPTHWMPLPPPPTTSAGSGKGE